MTKEKRFPIALTKEICPVCAQAYDGDIILGRIATSAPEGAHPVDKMHGQPTGFMKHMCKECKDLIGDNIWLVVIDEDKSGENIKDFFRCGFYHGLKREAVMRIFEGYEGLPFMLEHQFGFIDYRAAQKIGLPVDSYLEYLKTH